MAAEPIDVRTALAMSHEGDAVVDVREPSEYAEGHIDGALNIPIGALPGAELPKLPNGPLITTCAGGRRAQRAAEMLDELGRTAFWIEGGTQAWQYRGYPVVSGPEPTRRLRDRLGPVGSAADAVAATAETVTEKVVGSVTATAATVAAKAETVTEKVVDKLKSKS